MDKLTRWEYITSALALLLHTMWANYEYANDPTKIPYEPIISAILALCAIWGYVYYQNNKMENTVTNVNPQTAEKIYNVEEIGAANFGDVEKQLNFGKGATNIEKQYVTYEGDLKVPRFLTSIPSLSTFFIGREADLDAIEADYQQNNRLLVLVNGEGGMGKTTLATHYWHRHAARYTHLAWVFAESGVGNALTSLGQPLGVAFNPQDDFAAQIARVSAAIRELDAPCLFVFDNANAADDLEHHFRTLQSLTNCHILLTSRVDALHDVAVHKVKPLKIDFARQVFKNHYKKHSDTEGSLLDALLLAVGYNTLVIEVMAKNLAVFNKFQTTYSLASLVADLQTKGLLDFQNRPVKVTYQTESLRTETPEKIIAAMYDLSNLSETERYLLSNFAVLPAENIPFDTLIELLKPADAAALEGPLSMLQQKGWLDYFEDSNAFKMSQVIQAVTLLKNKERLLVDCDSLIRTLINTLDTDNLHNDFDKTTVFARFAEAVVAAMDEANFNTVILCQYLGTFFETIGNLGKAMYFRERCCQLSKELFELHPDNSNYQNVLAISYARLGETHVALGNLDKALEFYKAYNRLMRELFVAFPTNVEFKNNLAISYSKLGETHAALGNLDKALEFYKEYNRLEKELYTAFPTNVGFKNSLAISYSKLGEMHTDLVNWDRALGFYEEFAVLIRELYAAFPTNVEFKNNLAISYSKLGETHAVLGNLNKALGFYEEFTALFEELYLAFPTNVGFKNGLAISYSQLGWFYKDKKNYKQKAKEYFQASEILLIELTASFPLYVAFTKNLTWVQNALSALD